MSFADCENPKTQLEMNMCSAENLSSLNTHLDQLMKNYSANLGEEQRVLFQDSQKAWQLHRDKYCEFRASGVVGGSSYPLVLNHCLSQETEDRISKIEELFKCPEGDLSCP